MNIKVKYFFKRLRRDYRFSTSVSSLFSASINLAFILFNGVFGILYGAIWNGCVCVYYIFLMSLRWYLLLCVRREPNIKSHEQELKRKRIYIKTNIVLCLISIAMIAPITLMIKGERSYNSGLIPAIAIASYTVYRISMSIFQFKKANKKQNILLQELRTINLVDSLFSILTLQSTMVIANSGMNHSMQILMSWSSGAIFLVVIAIIVYSIVKNK